MDLATLNKQRKFVLIAVIAGLISIFLPWISVSAGFISMSVNGFHSYGIMAFLAFICAGVVALMGDQSKPLDKSMWMVELIAGAVALLFTVLYMTDISGIGGFGAGYGIGIWISLAASIGVLASTWLLKSPEHSLQEGFDSLKSKVATAANSNNSVTNTATPEPNKMDQLERLIKMKEEGKITEEEYEQMKSKML
jgi:hypothetical protein